MSTSQRELPRSADFFRGGRQYGVSPDGQRFLVNLAADEGAASPITLILNWKAKP